jgi:hypothetical protein
MTDSMTAEGWMKKSNFVKLNDNPIQATLALMRQGIMPNYLWTQM